MPTFRTRPSGSLTASIRDLVRSTREPNSDELAAVDEAVARNAHQMSLAQRVRAEAEAIGAAERDRRNPELATRFASNAAGMNYDSGERLAGHLEGRPEPYSVADADYAARVGSGATPSYRIAEPVLEPGQRRLFQGALAGRFADLLASGKTNAAQLTQAAGNVQENAVMQSVQDAIAAGDVQRASAISQGARPGTAIRLYDNIGSTGATFAPATGVVRADPAADPTNKLLPSTLASESAQADQRKAAAAASNAHARLFDAQAIAERAKKGQGTPAPAGYRWGAPDAQGNPTLVPIEGGPATLKATSSDAERISAGYSDRMDKSGAIIDNLEKTGVGKPGWLESMYRSVGAETAANASQMLDPERQKYRQAQEDWVRAKLRKESGAVIAADEMDREIRVYFPQIGDSAAVVKQKQASRKVAEAAMKTSAGRAAPKADAAGAPAGEVQARKKIGNVEFVKIGGKWFTP